MNIKEKLINLQKTINSMIKKDEVVLEEETKEEIVLEDETILLSGDTSESGTTEKVEEVEVEEEKLAEITIESLQEEIVNLSETISGLITRIEELENKEVVEEEPVEEPVEEEMSKDEKIEMLEKELEMSKEAAVEPIINEKKVELSESASFANKMKARIEKQRENIG